MKRIIIVVVVVLTIGAVAGYFYFSSSGDIPFSKDTTLYKAIPVTTPFFMEAGSLSSIPFGNSVMKEFALIDKSYAGSFLNLDSLIRDSKEISPGLRNTPFVIAFCFTGRNQLMPLLVKKVDGSNRKNEILQFIQNLFPPAKFKYFEKDYGKSKIIEINRGPENKPVVYSITNGLFIVSSESLLVEQAIRQLSSKGIVNNKFFQETYKSASSGKVSLFVNHSYFSGFMGNILNSDLKRRKDEFGDPVKLNARIQSEKFRNFASWSSLDLSFSKDDLIFNGYSVAGDSLNHYLSVFEGQQPVRFRADEILPQNISCYFNIALSDKKLFFKRLENYFIHTGSYYMREERMKRFEYGFRNNMREQFGEIVKDQIIVAAGTIPVDPDNKQIYFIFQTENQASAEEQMKGLLANYAYRENSVLDSVRSDYQLNSKVKIGIYKFPYPSFPGIWLGAPFFTAAAEYVAFYNNCMIFCNTEQGLKEYLQNIANGNTLGKDNAYHKAVQKNGGKANLHIYLDINKSFSLAKEIFTASYFKKITGYEENIRKFRTFNWLVQYSKGSFLNTLGLVYDPEIPGQAQTTWQSAVGNDIAKKPQLVINANNPVNREIIITDDRNNLLLLSETGIIRWSLPLPEPVMSEIYQVDYYRNGKLQYLFSTKNKIYLIDRNGKNCANFPIGLKSPATNGVNVFDYDRNRNYRYVIAGEDKKIYVYDFEGKIISGWNFGRTSSMVTSPVKHFKISGKDYIVFKDSKHIYICNRRGDIRVETGFTINFSDNPLFLNMDGTPKIVASDNTGKVHYIYFDGRHEEKRSSRLSKNHFFIIDDLNGDKTPEFIFTDKNEIMVFDENGKKQFGKKLSGPVSSPPNIYAFSNNLKKIGVVDAESNRIYLFDHDGKLHEGFPLQGNSEFSIGKLSDRVSGLNLVVGSRGGRLYNYTLK